MKKVTKVFLSLFVLFSLTGCLKNDSLEGITIYTTSYPIEYIVTSLYGEHSTIESIYPDGVNINEYSLSKKQIKDYSSTDLYVFNGLSKEKDYVSNMYKNNKQLMIIDATQSMEIINNTNELWMNPSDFLMMASNIKNGLLNYISNHYLKEEIETNYNNLKITISKLDAKLKLLSENSNNTLIVDTNALLFLEKYGFNIISLDEKNGSDKNISIANDLIRKGANNYIFTLNDDKINDNVKSVLNNNSSSKVIELNDISTITDEERTNNETYITLLTSNIEKIKDEIY